jgi:transposase
MAMGTREQDAQGSFWIPTSALPTSASHPFYEQVNRILDGRGFDGFVEDLCRKFYHERMGRPSLAPAVYFRLMMIGYFEGIDSERGMAWRVADSLGIRRFLGYSLTDRPPDHSTISRNRRLIDLDTHEAVFTWVLKVLAEEGLLKGKTIGVDATTLEANAAMKSIVRRDSGEGYQEFLTRLAQESGIETPTREDLAKLDKQRKNKASNDDWQNPHEPDAKITKMKDDRADGGGRRAPRRMSRVSATRPLVWRSLLPNVRLPDPRQDAPGRGGVPAGPLASGEENALVSCPSREARADSNEG